MNIKPVRDFVPFVVAKLRCPFQVPKLFFRFRVSKLLIDKLNENIYKPTDNLIVNTIALYHPSMAVLHIVGCSVSAVKHWWMPFKIFLHMIGTMTILLSWIGTQVYV